MHRKSFKSQVNEFVLEKKYRLLMSERDDSLGLTSRLHNAVLIFCGEDPQAIAGSIPDDVVHVARCVFCDSTQALLGELSELDSQLSVLFFDVDSFGGIENTFDDIRSLRETHPSTNVIFLSTNFLIDDLDLARLPLCDVSLRWPTLRNNLKDALLAAASNNHIWNDRLTRSCQIRCPSVPCCGLDFG